MSANLFKFEPRYAPKRVQPYTRSNSSYPNEKKRIKREEQIVYTKIYFHAIDPQPQSLELDKVAERKFLELASNWYNRVRYVTNVRDRINDVVYTRIIWMGRDALPFLLRELKHNPKNWIPALEGIAQGMQSEDPVPPEHYGHPDLNY